MWHISEIQVTDYCLHQRPTCSVRSCLFFTAIVFANIRHWSTAQPLIGSASGLPMLSSKLPTNIWKEHRWPTRKRFRLMFLFCEYQCRDWFKLMCSDLIRWWFTTCVEIRCNLKHLFNLTWSNQLQRWLSKGREEIASLDSHTAVTCIRVLMNWDDSFILKYSYHIDASLI